MLGKSCAGAEHPKVALIHAHGVVEQDLKENSIDEASTGIRHRQSIE